MIRIVTYAALDDVASADLNNWQDRTAGVFGHTASGATNGFDGLEGADTIAFQLTIPTATLVTIQASEDWRDRVLLKGSVAFPTAANRVVGGAADYLLNEPSTGPFVSHLASGYTGRGGNSNVGTGALVSAGNPPVNATGSIRMLAGAGAGYTVTCGAVVGDARRGYVEFPVPDNGAGVYGAMEYIIAATAGTPPELFGDITGYVE